MKMTQQHYRELFNLLAPKLCDPGIEQCRQAYKKEGLTPMRWRWDLFWSINGAKRTAFTDKVYAYLNDDHIDTALRKIVDTTW